MSFGGSDGGRGRGRGDGRYGGRGGGVGGGFGGGFGGGGTILAPSAATATIPARPAGPSVHFAGRDTMQGPCASRGSGSSSSARNGSNRLAMRVVIKAP